MTITLAVGDRPVSAHQQVDGPDAVPRVLSGHQPRTSLTFYGWGTLVVAVPFFAAGMFMLILGPLRISGATQVVPALKFILTWFGAIFALAGLWMAVAGFIGGLRRSRLRRMREQNPNEPWRWDYVWNPEGFKDDTAGRARQGLIATFFIAIFLVPFNVIATFATPRVVWMGGVGLFDAVTIACAAYTVYLMVRVMKFGASMLRFNRFPYLLGEPLEAHLVDVTRGETFRNITITLRCIEVFMQRSGENATAACRQLYADSRSLCAQTSGSLDRPFFSVAFPLPQGNYGTRLSDPLPRYWELEVKADAPGVDFGATFLVPIYTPGPPREEPSTEAILQALDPRSDPA